MQSKSFTLELSDGVRAKAVAVVIASGARYRRLDVPNLRDFEGRGVWYWASPIEARLCRREEIVLVGGGNSAGQAAVFLRNYAAKIWLLVRGPSLAESMSQYLIDRIEATTNIEVLKNTEVVALSGSPHGQLERIRWRHQVSGDETEKAVRHLFLFIGAAPATRWLHGCLSLTPKASFKPAQAYRRRTSARTTPPLCRYPCNPASPAFSRWATYAPAQSSVWRSDRRRGRGRGPTTRLFGCHTDHLW